MKVSLNIASTVIASDGINPSVEQSLTLNINDLDDAAPVAVSGEGNSIDGE